MFIKMELKIQLPPKITNRTFDKLAEIIPANSEKNLHITIKSNECSGFQYNIELDTKHEDDLILEREGNKVFIDSTSLPFLSNATIDFSEELIGARFIIDNPNASSSCGCGTSFSI
jgi:Iron-sulfur cluster assembly accessory protein